MFLTLFTSIPETTGLLVVGLGLILAKVILRRVASLLDGGLSSATHVPESKERLPK